jgi:transcriptional regulator with XRE-family HTH domain
MSLRDLEDLTGINRGDLSKIERGHGPTPPQARRLILIFGPQIA